MEFGLAGALVEHIQICKDTHEGIIVFMFDRVEKR